MILPYFFPVFVFVFGFFKDDIFSGASLPPQNRNLSGASVWNLYA